MARIYTRTGDRGETGLFDGTRTSKADRRVGLYGDVDELNSVVGMVCAQLEVQGLVTRDLESLHEDLRNIQSDLFVLGALLADPGRCEKLAQAGPEELELNGPGLEPVIDRLETGLPPLKAFILPGGDPAAATLHLARTVCRRVERQTVALREDGLSIPEPVVVYLNRLSDLFFVAARRVNSDSGRQDVVWPGSSR